MRWGKCPIFSFVLMVAGIPSPPLGIVEYTKCVCGRKESGFVDAALGTFNRMDWNHLLKELLRFKNGGLKFFTE